MTTPFRSPEMWLDPRSLQSRVGSNTWAKAQQLFLQNRVLALAIEPLTKYGPGRWQVTGKVKGSLARPYEVSCTVYLDDDGELRQWESDCTCPVELRCKHAVALLLKAAYQGHQLVAHHLPQTAAAIPAASPAWVQTANPGGGPSTTAGAARPLSSPSTGGAAASSNSLEAVLRDLISSGQELMARANQLRERELVVPAAAPPAPPSDAQLLTWLQALERASPVAATSAPTTALAPMALQPAPQPEYPLYLLSVQNVNAQPVLHLELTSAYRKLKGGDWSKPKKVRREPQSGQPVYDHATATDRHVFQLLRALQKPGSSTYYGGYYGEFQSEVAISGLAGVTVLQLAAQTGRLYAKSDKGNAQTPLRWGDELNVQWHWKELAGQRSDDDPQWWLQASLPAPQALLCR
ncbi:MAG: SWIM zinc finger family protein, partial [Macromonas sp.]